MYSFTSGTILSAGTCSPSMPGTQPVSLNISLASSRRAISSLVVVLLMIALPLREHRDPHLRLRIVCGEVHEHADPAHALSLLRPRHHWPRGHAPEPRDEFPPSHRWL